MKQTSSIGIMDFIRPHKGGFLCSVVLSVLGVASGIVPYAKGRRNYKEISNTG